EEHGQTQLARDRNHDAAFGSAIQLGQDDAGDARRFGKEAGLLHAVLSGGGVHDEQRLMRGAGDEAAGRVDDTDARLAGFGRSESVEKRCRWVSTLARLDNLNTGTLSPYLELLNGGGAKGVGRAKKH